MAASWMAAPWLLLEWLITLNKSRNDGYFADFEQVKNLPYTKTPLGEIGYLNNFLGYLSMSPALHLLLVRLVKVSTSSEIYPDCFPLLTFFSLFRYPVFLFTSLFLTQSIRLPLITYPHCAALMWLTGRHAMQAFTERFPPNPYLGKQRIFLGVAIMENMCLCSHTYNPGLNIWNKLEFSSKTGQEKKSLVSIFACFLTAIRKV